MTNQQTRTCEQCGGSITNEQIIKRVAGLVGGKLLCAECVDSLRRQHATTRSGEIRAAQSGPGSSSGTVAAASAVATPPRTLPTESAVPLPPAPAADPNEEPITLITESESTMNLTGGSDHGIRSFNRSSIGGTQKAHEMKRPVAARDQGATRCKVFHAKLSDAAISYLENQINDWVDGHPEFFLKFSTSTIGVFEGKHAEQHLIITVFY